MAFLQKRESELDSERFIIPTDTLQIVVTLNPAVDPYIIGEGGVDIIDTGYELVEGGVDTTQQTDTRLHESHYRYKYLLLPEKKVHSPRHLRLIPALLFLQIQ